MLRSVVSIFFCSLLLWAGESGEAIFEKRCASCHVRYIPQLKLNANYAHNNRDLNLSAPTLTELSFLLKARIGDRKGDRESQLLDIEDFIERYLADPKPENAVLDPVIQRLFASHPVLKLSEEEGEALASFIYDFGEKMMVVHGVKRYGLKEAFRRAKETGKIILIEGYLPFCRWCIKMDREVMVEPEVKAMLNKYFVFTKVNLITQKLPLGIKRLGTPSFYFIASNGKEVIDTVEGFGNKKEFLQLLQEIVNESKK